MFEIFQCLSFVSDLPYYLNYSVSFLLFEDYFLNVSIALFQFEFTLGQFKIAFQYFSMICFVSKLCLEYSSIICFVFSNFSGTFFNSFFYLKLVSEIFQQPFLYLDHFRSSSIALFCFEIILEYSLIGYFCSRITVKVLQCCDLF